MSCVVDGIVVNTDITKNAKGGTEIMRSRLLSNVESDNLKNVAIHFSRFGKFYDNKINILYVHDLPDDGMYNSVFQTDVYKKIDKFVFVSHHQKDLFIQKYKIPYSKVVVIHNAIGDYFNPYKDKDKSQIKFIYHTTPHRGLHLLYPIFDELSKNYDNISLDVFSSFKVYGWAENDRPYQDLFDKLNAHKNITYHGAVENDVVLDYLKKSHIFLYPCIWHETSCLALMEAIQNGCICIHPDYGALPETAKENTFMYSMSDNINELTNKTYFTAKYILNNMNQIEAVMDDRSNAFKPYSIKDYAYSWNNLLRELKHGRNL